MHRPHTRRMSLKWKLPLLLGALLVVVITALCGAAYYAVRQSTEQAAALRLREVTSQLRDLLAVQGEGLGRRAGAAAALPAVRAYLTDRSAANERAIVTTFDPAAGADTSIVAIQLLSPNGGELFATGPLASLVHALPERSDLPGMDGATDSARVGQLLAQGDTILFPSIARVSAGTESLGYLVIWRRSSTNPRSSAAIAALIGSEARFQFGTRGGTWMDEGGRVDAPALPTPDTASDDPLLRYHRGDSQAVLANAMSVRGTPWEVVVEFPTSVVYAPANRFLGRIAMIGGILLLIGVAGSLVVARHIATPLLRLTAATMAFGRGSRGTRVGVEGDGEIGRLAEAFNRMAKDVDDQAAVRESSEAQWRLLFDQNPRPMWVTDQRTGWFLAVNESALELYGLARSEFLATSLKALRVPDPAESGAGKEMGVTPFERHQTRERGTIEVEITRHALLFGGQPAELALVQNITARKMQEVQARQAQKMEAVGRLAGGVAHDFNNLLAVISPYAELMREEVPPGSRQAEDLEHIIAAAERGRALTRQLLTFSRQNVVQATTLNPNDAVRDVEGLLRRLVSEDVELIFRLGAGPGHIRVDPGQFEQILINLAVNARDAMPQGGQLVVATADWTIDQESLDFHGLKGEGRYMALTVTDTGVGMDAATCSRVFEPFFTTKAPGKGTGIGLATVYGIVTQAGGQITVYSEPGLGTTFRLYFPIVAKDTAAVHTVKRSAESLRGDETILLVEDDAAVRAAAVGVLERFGYHVLVATGPEDAQEIAARHRKAINMVISDVVMPRMSGPTLLATLRSHRPDIKVLLISGYAGEALSARGELAEDIPFLEKPFTVSGLLGKVRDVLDGSGDATRRRNGEPASGTA
jgi:two-component system cell cycle sensor histidine kinase/response regulator CckA